MNSPKKPRKESKLFTRNRIKLAALFISLGAHMVFIVSSSILRISDAVIPPTEPQQFFQVKIARNEAFLPQPPAQTADAVPREAFRFESPTVVRNIESFLEKEKEDSKDKQSMVLHDKMDELAKVTENIELVGAKYTQDYDHLRNPVERKTASRLMSTIELNREDLVDEAHELVDRESLYKDFTDKMPGFTPALVKNTFDVAQRADVTEFKQQPMPVISRVKDVGDLTQELIWTLGVYQDPRDEQKYFKISFRVGEESRSLKTINKEVVFLIDASASTQDDRLEQFRRGIVQSLSKLNEGDLYNVTVFKELTFEFQPESVPPTQANIDKTVRFLERFRAAEKTDAFEVLSKSIEKTAQRSPSYIILMSDGRPTKGVTNSREVINRIAKINDGKNAIFTLSGGLRVNRYLLDFIAYRNRGWSEFSSRTNSIHQQVVDLYQKIDDPIILNLRYYLSGLDAKETFPVILPDFFRHAEFTLYGKYDKEKEFAMQLLGDVEGKTKEYLLKSDFKEAYKGDKDIARDWAFNKLFHLISLLKHDGDNEDILVQINELSEKFALNNPYLQEIIQ